MKDSHRRFCCSLVLGFSLSLSAQAQNERNNLPDHLSKNSFSKSILSFDRALSVVLENDLNSQRLTLQQTRFEVSSEGADSLPDPVVFASVANLPTDSFDLDQEPMTQMRLGVRQTFPRGQTLSLQRELDSQQAKMSQTERLLRQKQVQREFEMLWLDAWYWQQYRQLLEGDQAFLEQIQELIESLYEVGARDQQDLLEAELQLFELSERQSAASRNFTRARRQLDVMAFAPMPGEQLEPSLPFKPFLQTQPLEKTALMVSFEAHPEMLLLDEKADTSRLNVALSEQGFEPKWGLELAYGFRQGEQANGGSRPDLFSAGVSMQLPLFSSTRQRSQVLAERVKQQDADLTRVQRLQQVALEYTQTHQELGLLIDQRVLYERSILPTLYEQKDITLSSYEADQADLNAVFSVFLKTQTALNRALKLQVEQQRLLSKLNYWTPLSFEPTTEHKP